MTALADHGAFRASAKVGPNAVIQLAQALRAKGGDGLAVRIFSAAGALDCLSHPPEEMVDERIPIALFASLTRQLDREEARAILTEAGRLTGEYILAHRIPRVARIALRILPRRQGLKALLKAIGAHAWTFAGSGTCHVDPATSTVSIADNPLATLGCPWHIAVFETLTKRLVSPRAKCTHTACCLHGAPACRFVIAV
ncbi:MAG: bacteriochlorophyll 4-vinyl reductase [Pseudomonadota bacterium]